MFPEEYVRREESCARVGSLGAIARDKIEVCRSRRYGVVTLESRYVVASGERKTSGGRANLRQLIPTREDAVTRVFRMRGSILRQRIHDVQIIAWK